MSLSHPGPDQDPDLEPVIPDTRCCSHEDYVFLDESKPPRPYRVRKCDDGHYWLYRMHPDRSWVSLRPLKNYEYIAWYNSRALPYNTAKHYEFGVPFIGFF